MSHPVSPRPTLYPTTPVRDVASLSPFSLFSEEKRRQLRAAEAEAPSPAMTFEELARIIAEEWENLPEENKTPYRERADGERLRHEAVSAALVLTQIATPPLRSLPATPVPRPGQRARRCLDIGTSDWQSPRAPRNVDGSPYSGYHDEFDFDPDLGGIFTDAKALLAGTDSSSSLSHVYSDGFTRSGGRNAGGGSDSLGGDCSGARQAPSAAAGSFAWSSPAPPPSVGSPPAPSPLSRGPDGGIRPPGHAGSFSVDGNAATSRRGRNKSSPAHTSTTPAAGTVGTTLRTPGSGGGNGGGEGGGGLIGLVGKEVRAADGAKESMSENQEGNVRGSSQALAYGARGRAAAAPEKGEVEAAAEAVPARAASSNKKRKAPFSSPSSISSPPVSSASASSSAQQAFSPSESTSSSWSAAAAAAVRKNGKSDRNSHRAQEKIRKAECKTGRQLVSKMSKKDAARPKGPQSSYIWFYKERAASMKAVKPAMNIMDIGTTVGEAWRSLPKEMKLPYTELAQADRQRYERELRAIARNAVASAASSPTISASNASDVVAATDPPQATYSLSTP